MDADVWQQVQAMLTRNNRSGGQGGDGERRDDALLRGLLVCRACGCSMMPSYTVKRASNGTRQRYRYYVCYQANRRGRSQCSCPTLPAGEIERFVVDEIAAIGRDPDIRDRVLDEAAKRLADQGDKKPIVMLDRTVATVALAEFQPLWQTLTPAEQRRLIRLLVERVDLDAVNGRVAITFQPTGIATLGAPNEDDEGRKPDAQEVAA